MMKRRLPFLQGSVFNNSFNRHNVLMTMHPPAQDSDDAAKKAFVSDKFPFRMRLLLVLAAAIPFLIFFKFPVENVESKGNIKSANANTVGSKFIITNNDDYEDDADSDDDVEEDAKENDREDKTKTQETLENSKKSTSTASPSLINHNGTTSLDFVLHVGLAKTGTTSIQGALGMSLYQHMVEKDNYYFLGKTRGLGPKKKWGPKERAMVDKDVFNTFGFQDQCLFTKINRPGCTMESRATRKFIRILRDHHRQGHHLVISEEFISHLSEQRLEFLDKIVRSAGYTPRVIITTRYYHEWVVSWIQQEFRPANWNKKWYIGFDEASSAVIPTISQFLQDPFPYHGQCPWDECFYQWTKLDQSPAEYLRQQFSRIFGGNAQIFQFNQEGDLAVNFICQTLLFAQNTCQGLQNGIVPIPPVLNEAIPRYFMDYEYLAQGAYHKYKLKNYKFKRRALVNLIKAHHALKLSDCDTFIFESKHEFCQDLTPLETICLTQEEQAILANRSLEYERILFPNLFTSKQMETQFYQAAIGKMTSSEKYCVNHVDANLAKAEWDVFFQALAQGIHPYGLKDQPWDNNN